MKPPIEVQQLSKIYLEKVKQDSEHKLADKDRLELYRNFGPSRMLYNSASISLSDFTVADFALSWLAILTAKKVAFICKRGPAPAPSELYIGEAEEVKEILAAVKGYLSKKTTFKEAENVSQKYWYFVRPHLTYDVLCAWRTSMQVLEFVLYGAEFNETLPGSDYFVTDAVKAYTVTDHNWPGEGDWPEPPIPLEYHIGKRLRFWEWWLTEAIPQAWELAQPASLT